MRNFRVDEFAKFQEGSEGFTGCEANGLLLVAEEEENVVDDGERDQDPFRARSGRNLVERFRKVGVFVVVIIFEKEG